MWTKEECLKIEKLLGGRENINEITNCFTRLHIQLLKIEEDFESKKSELMKIKGVKGVFVRNKEVQLVIGIEAAAYEKELKKQLGI